VQIKCTAEWRPWPHPPIHPQMPMHPEINQQIKLSLAHSLEKQWHFNPSIQSSCAKTNPKHTKKRVKIGGFRVLNKTLVVILLSSQS
jgi:mRNA-degrading endonuclease RelE of RelBE toxin-antitoxin system